MDLLVRSFDNELTESEERRLEKALEVSAELRAEREALLRMRQVLKAFEPGVPQEFSEQVMQKISTLQRLRESFSAAMVELLPRVAAACILVLLIILVSIYWSEGSLTTDALVGISDVSPEEAVTALADQDY